MDEPSSMDQLSYKKLYLQACYKLNALQEEGLGPGDELIFQFESNRNFVITFWACVLGKIIPVPVAFAAGANTVRKLSGIWKKLNNPYLISDNAVLKATLSEFEAEDEAFDQMLARFIVFDELKNSKKAAVVPADESDTVFIQFSSGSTGNPKGITNTHEAIVFNFNDYQEHLKVDSNDRFLGWVPLIHDMGLIFFHIVPLLANAPQFLMPPAVFVAYPEIWMESISKNQITISGSPNFGYRMVLDNLDRMNTENLAFDQVRFMINSAEPVSIRDCKAFQQAFEPYGLPKNTVRASYGLAEAVLGVSMNYKNDPESLEYLLDRSYLNVGDQVKINKSNSEDVGAFANLGTFTFTEINIVNDSDEVLPDRTLGYIRLKSKAITKGYYNDPEISEKVISSDGWLNTGDIGFIDNKDLVITGRAKEMIIINGQNYFPNDLDYVLSEIPELNFQQAVACSVFNDLDHEDEIFVFVLYKDTAENFNVLANEIRRHISDRLGLEVNKVVPVGQIPKTTSGKVQRYVLRERYTNGEYDELLDGINDLNEDPILDQYTAPNTDTERRLVKIWEQYFDLDRIGTEANFYFLGGNSIGLGKLGVKIEDEFGISIDIRRLLACVSFQDQVELIKSSSDDDPLNKPGKGPIKSNYPLFTTQKRLFALYEADKQSLAYNIPVVIDIKGTLDIERCENVFKEIIHRHEVLRTSFNMVDGTPLQQIHDHFDFAIQVIEDGEPYDLLKEHMKAFDLSAPPLLRVLVCKVGDKYTKLILDIHHIVSDGASFEIIVREFHQLYAQESLAPLELQYRDFIEWNNGKLKGLNLDAQKAFWVNQFTEPVKPLKLPPEAQHEISKTIHDGDTVKLNLNADDEAKLRKLCEEERVTMSTTTLAVFNVLLSKLSNSDDIVVGTSSLGRWNKSFADLIGLFVDTLPIRSNPSHELAFSEFLQRVSGNVSDSMKNGDFSFEELFEELKLTQHTKSNTLFNTVFEYYNFDWSSTEFEDLQLLASDQAISVAKFPFALRILEKEQGCEFCFDYSTNEFTRATVERFGSYYLEIVKAIIENKSILLGDIQILPESEVEQLLSDLNDSSAGYENDKSLLALFADQVANNPSQTAITFSGKSVTYNELDQRSTQLARYIRRRNNIQSSLIGLYLDRSMDTIIGTLAILKSGNGYVPIEESLPTRSIEEIIEDAGLALVVTSGARLEAFENVDSVRLDLEAEAIAQESTGKIPSPTNVSETTCVIYTSVDTDSPKGVVVKNQNIVGLVKQNGPFHFEETDGVLQWSNVAHEGAMVELFGSLLNGATLHIMDKEAMLDVKNLSDFIAVNEVSVALFPTAIFNAFVDSEIEGLSSLRKLIFKGARASLKHVQKAYNILGPGKLIHCYGPVENIGFATCFPINEVPNHNVPIGKALSNTRTYVLDASENLCGIGITGELHIGGDHFSAGYLGDGGHTVSKFIDNPFESGTRLFKTGDLVRWLPDGNLEFVGREDEQVEWNGYRIDLSDIAFQLGTFNTVNVIAVMIKEIEAEEHIVAYYNSPESIDSSVLKTYLSVQLPEYMIPAVFVQVEALPLTRSGQVDLKTLPEPTITEPGFVAPSTETEHKLVSIWADVLNVDPEGISVNNSFFDHGGYSLNALAFISRINKEFAVKISASDILANPTIADMQNLILQNSGVDHISIPVAEESTHYPLSSSQKRMYYLHEYDKDSISYNVPLITTLTGDLDREKLGSALQQLVQRHENLRTVFEFSDGELMQCILSDVSFDIQTLENGEGVKSTLSRFVRPFDLSRAPLFRVGLERVSDSENILILDTHHIISDGITNVLLFRELIALYNGESLPECRIQYKDYVLWEQGEEYQNEIRRQKEYWLERFATATSPLELPYDAERPETFDVVGKNYAIELDKDQVNRLADIAQSEGVTMYNMVLALYNLLLYKLTNQNDIVIGTSVAGRSHIDLESVAGVFINTLALRNEVDGALTFKEFLQQVKHNNTRDLEHQLYPYDDLVNELNVERVSGRNVLFDVFLAYPSIKNDGIADTSLLDAKLYTDLYPTAQFDLILTAMNLDDKLKLNFTYREELFKEETIVRFTYYLLRIIDQILVNDAILIDEMNILSQQEVNQQINEFNNTAVPYDKEKSLVSIFEQKVALHSDRIAISYEGKTLTYKELDERSNKVANYLIGEGTIPNVVGLLIDRSVDMIVGIWGALKVGAGYLPLDPTLPEDRIRYMLDHSGTTFLLTHERYLDAYSAYLPVQTIDSTNISSQSTGRVTFRTEPNDLAYCIFTSGSTGKPKGVMINHANVINLVKGLVERVYQFYGDKVLQVALLASYAFDASVQQIFGALLQGHSLYIAGDETRKDGVKLNNFFNENNIDVTDGTPTHLRMLVNANLEEAALQSLSSWLLAGEVLSKDLVSNFYKRFGEKTQLYNFYGPTETCVDSTSFKVDPSQLDDLITIPIGKPLPNERVYVTDHNGALLPIGVVGELCIAGDGLAQRYIGDQTLTTEKFNAEWIAQERRVYRTGDMVRWLPDGNLEYYGRKDNQVKVRGYRIELGEIEKQLNIYAAVEHAVVLVKESETEKYLVAYYQAVDKLEVSELRGYLSKFLPDYMIPNYFVHVEKFDLTLTGKVDYKALPDYRNGIEGQVVTSPVNEVERKLAAIYAEVLDLDSRSIGRESSFIELGGHSLKMVYLANGIEKEFSVRVSLKHIIENPSLDQLSALISRSTTSVHTQIMVSELMEFYPLSSAQRRMYFAHQYDKKSLSFNVPMVFNLNGELDKEKLEASFDKLIKRHESLRTEFLLLDGALSQRVLTEVNFSIDYIKSEGNLDRIIRDFSRPFDLSGAPLLRVGIVEVSDTENVLIMDSHHIISDEVTSTILFKDLSSIYNGESLSELRVQYKDFVMWQIEAQQQEEIERQKTYWLEKFSSPVTALELPYDFPRTKLNSDDAGHLLIKIDPSKTEQLKEIASKEGITLYSLYLAMYKVLLYKLSSQKDIVVGTPLAGRPHHDLENIAGVFINILPVRNQVSGEMTFAKFVQQVQSGSAVDLDHQLYPYEDLVDALDLKRELTRNPLFDVSFNYMKQDLELMTLSGLGVTPSDIQFDQSKFDMTMIVVEREEDNYLRVEYAKQLFKKDTVARFMKYFDHIIQAVCDDRTIKIADIEIFEDKETQRFNSIIPMNNSNLDPNTIVSVFERQVSATPNATAIKYGDVSFTYDELNQRVNQVARSLQLEHDIYKGDLVGVLLPKSDSAIVSILATLKLGAAYLPIDTTYPIERIKYIIENSGLNALITDDNSCSEEIHVDCQVYYEDIVLDQENTNLNVQISSNDLAYVIYTSGSTGKPKGAMIEHRSNVNMSTDIVRQLNVNDRDTILWFASIGFDASVYEIMMGLYSGATLVIPEEGVINDITRFCSLISETRTTIITLPPSYLETLPLDKLSSLRIITTAGEAANAKKAIEVVKSGIRYFNAYGPTECAVCVSTYEVYRDDEGSVNIPIGRPIANTEMIIVNDDFNPVVPGVKGTIYVSGEGVGRGYLNNKELTEKSFVDLPHDRTKKYYNTGDLGEWTPNGQIIFHGRRDNQIKLRGYRIELAEIEGTLSSLNNVRHCHVTLREGVAGEKELIAFVILDGPLDKTSFERDLGKLLPEYMVPKSWRQLDEFPLTSNGKIDTKALLRIELEEINENVGASGDVETKLVQIWSEILELDESSIGVTDDFFDLNGNSLLAIQLLTAINKNYGIQLELQEIFKRKTIRGLSELIELDLWVIDDERQEVEFTETVI